MTGLARMTPTELPPGIAITARVEEGRCASGRVISHRGMRLTPAGSTYLLSTDDADAVHFAFYRTSDSRIDREPYQQSGAAYLPLDFSQLRSTSIAGYGVMLVETTIRHLGLDAHVSDDGIRSLFPVFVRRVVQKAVCGCELYHQVAGSDRLVRATEIPGFAFVLD